MGSRKTRAEREEARRHAVMRGWGGLPANNEWAKIYKAGKYVTFVPNEEATDLGKSVDNGRKFSFVNINGCQFIIWYGQLNTLPETVWHFYADSVQLKKEADSFKEYGPTGPHTKGAPDAFKTWHYQPGAYGSWMDANGRYLDPNKNYVLLGKGGHPSPDGIPTEIPKDCLLPAASPKRI